MKGTTGEAQEGEADAAAEQGDAGGIEARDQMRAIYEPKGAAREYAPLALNLYRGCAHRCRYCYAPACLRMDRAEFGKAKARPPHVLRDVERDVAEMVANHDERRVLLSFTSDPYQPLEEKLHLTRAALCLLIAGTRVVSVLTKNPARALNLDGDLLLEGRVHLGTTIAFTSEGLRRKWEPGAPPIVDRIYWMKHAHAMGLRTWISMEPVIDPDDALAVMDVLKGHVDLWKIGKLNHVAGAAKIDWPGFLRRALVTMADQHYYIKDALWTAGHGAESGFPKSA